VSYCVGVVANYNTNFRTVKRQHLRDVHFTECVQPMFRIALQTTSNGPNLMNVMRLAIAGLMLSLGLTSLADAACQGPLDVSYRRLADKQDEHLCTAYAGKVLLIVNTASKCGFTPQYEGLEALHARLQSRGFAVLGFPSNDFMEQEPGNEQEIAEFCTLTYGVKFPMFEKVVVKGDAATPLYRDLTSATGQAPGWNFHKYLIDRSGKVVANFGSRTAPDDAGMLAQIERLLNESAPPKAAD